MPLDTGAVMDFRNAAGPTPARLRPGVVVLDPAGDVGAALRAARESLGLAIDDVAMATRMRPQHVAAIESFDFSNLPSRPFTVGYVRAYARTLGLDGDAVVARFKAEAPAPDNGLRPPMGLDTSPPARLGLIVLFAGLIIGGFVTWNVARWAMASRSQAPAARLSAAGHSQARQMAGPAHLAGPLPAPPEATTPAPYETPGLAAAANAGGSADAAEASARNARAMAAKDPVASVAAGAAFVASGTIYGSPAGASGVILQAVKPTSLVVHGQNGTVYFARMLAAGEAWRAPDVAGLTADVGAPASMEVFVGGLSRGPMTEPKTPLARLEGRTTPG
ncbi:MAG TPA: helix-turn-helix domain-containing protein [Caulobacteraceae bacterium]